MAIGGGAAAAAAHRGSAAQRSAARRRLLSSARSATHDADIAVAHAVGPAHIRQLAGRGRRKGGEGGRQVGICSGLSQRHAGHAAGKGLAEREHIARGVNLEGGLEEAVVEGQCRAAPGAQRVRARCSRRRAVGGQAAIGGRERRSAAANRVGCRARLKPSCTIQRHRIRQSVCGEGVADTTSCLRRGARSQREQAAHHFTIHQTLFF